MENRITWFVKDLTLNIENMEYAELSDRYGTPYHCYPKSVPKATFEITGAVTWEGSRAWTKAKMDGLIPYLNQKLREYEDGFLS
jgi:hypothetical protein